MAEIFQNNFSAGWTPSDDSVNGNPNGLLRMDNLKLDENGAVTICKGTSVINVGHQFASRIHSVYSKYVAGSLWRVVGIGDGSVYASDTTFDPATSGTHYFQFHLGGGSLNKAAFGTAFNQILSCSGAKKLKWNPTLSLGNPTTLGVSKPTVAPTLVSNAVNTLSVIGTIGSWVAGEGTFSAPGGTSLQVIGDVNTFRGSAQVTYGAPLDTTALSGSSSGGPDDLFNLAFQVGDSTKLYSVKIEFFMDATPSNYYIYQWLNSGSQLSVRSNYDSLGNQLVHRLTTGQTWNLFRDGASQYNTLSCKRGDFTRVGTDLTKNWKNITGVRVTFYATAQITCVWNAIAFNGGTLGPLDGFYEYCQVNINTQVGYNASSPRSTISTVELRQTSCHITPQNPNVAGDGQADKCAIYRRGGNLDKFYQVKLTGSGGTVSAFDDTMSDSDALLLGIVLNENLAAVKDITDDIYAIVGPFFNRMIYFTGQSAYISEINNPDSYDAASGVLNLFNTQGEAFLWAIQVNNSTIIVGSTANLYEMSGTLSPLPDGTIDVLLRPLGVKNPPINDAVCLDSGIVFYCANDGWRTFDGNGSQPFSIQLRKLFKGEDRYGVKSVKINPANTDIFAIASSKSQLFTVQVLSDGNRVIWVYDLIGKYWWQYNASIGGFIGPLCLFTEENGNIIAGYQDATNYFLRTIDTGTLLDGTTKATILFRTHVNNGNLPRNRKDSYTLKLKLQTGGDPVQVQIYPDESATPVDLQFISRTTLSEVDFDIRDSIGLVKSYQLEISGTVGDFKLVDYSITYDPRPEQTTSKRTEPTNFGIIGRKRINQLPFVIDSLGYNVTVIPYVDNIAQTSSTILTNEKLTKACYFSPDIIGKDFFLLIRSLDVLDTSANTKNPFEFYGQINPQIIEIFPDQSNYLTIAASNLGTPNKKRFRTIPFVCNTNNNILTFTPYLDGVAQTSQSFINNYKGTLFYQFTTDVFAIDFGAVITGTNFEFYNILDLTSVPAWVEILPIGRLFDQVGPIEFKKLGTLKALRCRILAEGAFISYKIYMDDTLANSGNLGTLPNIDKVYEIPWTPKNLYGGTMRIEFVSANLFHRWNIQAKISQTGGETENQWINL